MNDADELAELDVVARWTADGELRRISPSVRRVLGYDPGSITGRTVYDFLHPGDHDAVRRRHAEMLDLRHPGVDVSIYRYRCMDGTYRWLETAVRSIVGDDGRVVEIESTSRDATRRVLAERALAESEARFRSAFDGAPIGMAIVALDGSMLRVNPALCALTGYSGAELRELRFEDLTHPDDVTDEEALSAQLLGGDIDTYQLERRFLARDGTTIWALRSSSLVRDEDGLPLHFVDQVQDITARRAAEDQLRREREEAEHASRAKSDFISRLSHEVRTPLNAILGFSQVLRRTAELDTTSADHLDHVLAAASHLAEIINDLVDSARVERGVIEAAAEPVAVDAAVEEALALVRALADARGVEVSAIPGGHTVQADARRLTQVFVNLLSNAVKYNRPGGWVRVRSDVADGDRVRIAVHDSGIGIEPGALRKVFLPFERAAGDHADGSGLGLTVTAAFVEAMGGEVEVESTEGAGSTFSVVLPSTVPRSAPHQSDRRQHRRTERGRVRVLHVEDDALNRDLMERMLAMPGNIDLTTAATAAEAVELARSQPPDLVLLDLNLPDRDGETVLDDLALDDRTRDVPVVIVSSAADEATVKRLLARGVRAYLTKPLDLGDVLRTVLAVSGAGPVGHEVGTEVPGTSAA